MSAEKANVDSESPDVQHPEAAAKGCEPKKDEGLDQSSSNSKATHKRDRNVTLTEEPFGYVVDDAGKRHQIKKFTWRNHNHIQVQVITYGARITSIRLPNRKGVIEDVVMGFDDIAGYLYYDNLYMGATIGRVTNRIENGTFVMNQKQHWLSVNDNLDHYNGGCKGLDKVVWIPSVQGSKVLLSYVSRDLDEGYPGDLLVRVAFELNPKNEFIVDMDAVTTKPTIVNLSNLLYFNLAEHGAGPEELYKHVVSINADCFLPVKQNGLPTGEILNVIYTTNDFQIPKLLKKEMGIKPDDGFDEHLCINRGVDQALCFMARALHPPSGRILEMYSNQRGMHFSTANQLGFGAVDVPVSIPSTESTSTKQKDADETENVFNLIEKLHAHVAETATIDSKTNYMELRDLINKFHGRKFSYEAEEHTLEPSASHETPEQPQMDHPEIESVTLNPLQARYLEGMLEATIKRGSTTSYSKLGNIIREILNTATVKDELEMHRKSESVEVIKTEIELYAEQLQQEILSEKEKEDAELERKGMTRLSNNIPSFYKDGRIHGKNNAIYKRHGAMCFQSQNYPNAIYHKNFPDCKLIPGETYRHTILYKFWVQSGIPNKWIKRNCPPPRT